MATYAVLTSSDLGSRGQRTDTSGDAIVEIMDAAGHQLADRSMLPDEIDQLAEILARWCDSGKIGVVLTTGGTGFGPRDVMPEATARVIEFEIPGIPEAMRSQTLAKTPMAMISRAKAGARGRTLIVNLPGSPKGVRETLEVVLPVLGHAVDILQNRHAGPHPV